MKKTALLFLLALNLTISAQQVLRSEGPIPADLRLTYEQLYESDLRRTAEVAGGKVKEKEAVEQVSYGVSKLLSGGRNFHIVHHLCDNAPSQRILHGKNIFCHSIAIYHILHTFAKFFQTQ